MSTPLKELIDSIKIDGRTHIGPKSKAYVDALHRIDDMIGLTEIKGKISKHLRHSMKKKERGEKPSGFHNIIFTGGPGRGKTQMAKLLGEAYVALGFFEQPRQEENTVTIPLKRYYDLMRTFHSCAEDSKKLYKYKKPIYEARRRRKIARALSSACIMSEFFSSIPLLKDTSDVIINDVLGGKYHRTDDAPYDYGTVDLVKSNTLPPRIGKCIVYSKGDLVGSYVGQTAPKTKKALEECLGGVFVLDEAYSLLNISGDKRVCSFGIEALNTMNQYISEHQSELLVILCGYKDLIGVLKDVQRGLYRRFRVFFNITDYSSEELVNIYFSKLPPHISVPLDLRKDVSILISKYKFPSQVGDIENLVLGTEIEYDNDVCETLTLDHVKRALEDEKQKQEEDGGDIVISECASLMYM